VLFYNILTVNGSNFPRVVNLVTDRPQLPNVYPQLLRGTPPAFNPLALYVNSPEDLQNPTTHFYSASIQRQIRRDFLFEVGYSGARSYHGIGQGSPNPSTLTDAQAATVRATGNAGSIPGTQARRIFPQFGQRVSIQSNAKSNFNSIYTKLDKRLSHGLLFGATYTFSATLSDNDESLGVGAITNSSPQIPQDFNNFHSEYSRSVFDRPHRYSVYFNYDTPWFKDGPLANGVVRRVFGGWTLAGFSEFQSGQPFTIRTGVDTYGVGSTAARPDFNPGGSITLDPVSHDFRTFVIPGDSTGLVVTQRTAAGSPLANSSTRFGNLGRNTFRGPGFDNQNFSMIKHVPITERVQFELRADFIDLFNHRNFGNPVATMNSSIFGTNTSDPGGRQILLSGRIRF